MDGYLLIPLLRITGMLLGEIWHRNITGRTPKIPKIFSSEWTTASLFIKPQSKVG